MADEKEKRALLASLDKYTAKIENDASAEAQAKARHSATVDRVAAALQDIVAPGLQAIAEEINKRKGVDSWTAQVTHHGAGLTLARGAGQDSKRAALYFFRVDVRAGRLLIGDGTQEHVSLAPEDRHHG